jgi:hypothetical protein
MGKPVRDHTEDICVNIRVISKQILKKWRGRLCVGLMWRGVSTNEVLLRTRNLNFLFCKMLKSLYCLGKAWLFMKLLAIFSEQQFSNVLYLIKL